MRFRFGVTQGKALQIITSQSKHENQRALTPDIPQSTTPRSSTAWLDRVVLESRNVALYSAVIGFRSNLNHIYTKMEPLLFVRGGRVAPGLGPRNRTRAESIRLRILIPTLQSSAKTSHGKVRTDRNSYSRSGSGRGSPRVMLGAGRGDIGAPTMGRKRHPEYSAGFVPGGGRSFRPRESAARGKAVRGDAVGIAVPAYHHWWKLATPTFHNYSPQAARSFVACPLEPPT